MGKVLGIFRFSYDKRANGFMKSKLLEVYSRILWTIVIVYTPYDFYNAVVGEIQFAGSDENGSFLTAITYFIVYTTLYLSILTMFWTLFFGKENLLVLANRGLDLYRSVARMKMSPKQSTDRMLWLLFIKIVILGNSMAVLLWYHTRTTHGSFPIFSFILTLRMISSYVFCLDMRNFIFLVATEQMKLLRLKLFKLNETSILRVEDFMKITELYQKTLDFLSNTDELFNYHVSSLFLYFLIDEISMVCSK
jgi:hypothetical protein